MMLFVHDHTFVEHNGSYYTTGSLNQRVMDRYISYFDKVDVFATVRAAGLDDMSFVRAENKVAGLGFHLMPRRRSIGGLLSSMKPMEQEVRHAECVVVRMSLFGAIAVHYARKYRVPYLVEMVACPWDSLWYHSLKGKILAPFMTLLTKKICWQAPYVIYVTQKFLQRRYPTKGRQIGCSDVELTAVNPDVLSHRLGKIQKMGSATRPLHLATVANVAVRYKGQDYVIKAIAALRKRGIEFEYSLIGGGDPSRLQALAQMEGISDLVHIIGPVPHENVFDYLDGVDVYVQPSLQEGLPRAVVEAMSRGCPVVGSNAGGIPELLDDDCVFDKGSSASLEVILSSIDIAWMSEKAKTNYARACGFKKTILDEKRANFYREFAQYSKEIIR